MKRVAVVGFGFMGRTHYGVWKRLRGAKVVAICDANLAQLTNKVKGNNDAADQSTDFTGVAIYDDFDKMLDAGGFDVVDVTLPTFLHPAMTEKALALGLNVLCEKPMAVDAKTCDRMIAAAGKAKGKLMIAQCLRFAPQIAWIKDAIDSGKFGKVASANFSRISMTPGWAAGNGKSWFLDESKSGGVALDLHIHDADLVNHFFGIPSSVFSRAHFFKDGAASVIVTNYLYDGMVVAAEGNWGAAPSFVFECSFRIMFEDGTTIVFDSRREKQFVVYPSGKGKPFTPKFPKGEAYDFEIKWFSDWIDGKAGPAPLTLLDARNSVAIVDAERKSAKTGRPAKVAAKK